MSSTKAHPSTTSPPPASLPSPTVYTSDPRLVPLEAEVLHEYALLRHNLNLLSSKLAHLAAATPYSGVVADGLRLLERKTALVCTALKSSVYGILLQQQIGEAEGSEGVEEWGDRTMATGHLGT